MAVVVLVWILLQTAGWALVYLPSFPRGFTFSPGVDGASYPSWLNALNFSLVALSTLGFGDAIPLPGWLRVAAPLQALTGFALLTSALTWFAQIYAPLARRRALALHLAALHELELAERIVDEAPVLTAEELRSVAQEIERVRADLHQNDETYYFWDSDPRQSLARQLPYVLRLLDAAKDSASLELQVSAARLRSSIEQLASAIRWIVGGENLDEVFEHFRRDHERR